MGSIYFARKLYFNQEVNRWAFISYIQSCSFYQGINRDAAAKKC